MQRCFTLPARHPRTLAMAIVLLACLAVTGCGRKPSVIEPPEGATTYTYPPLDQKP